jgi:hypothetical protein
MNKGYTSKLTAVLAGSVLVLTSACAPKDSDGNAGGNEGGGQTAADIVDLSVDASSYSDTVYINLDTAAVFNYTDAEAASSDDWHIGINRYDIITNGGVSGSGNVKAALAVTPEGFYADNGEVIASTFINADAATYEPQLLAEITEELNFVSDTANSAIKTAGGEALAPTYQVLDYSWYTYNLTTHALAANTSNVWQLRSGEGTSYAQMRANSVSLVPLDAANGVFAYSVVLDFAVAADGSSGFAGNAAQMNVSALTDGEVCFDWDSNANVACSGSVWDVKLSVANRKLALFTNSGASGDGSAGVFGPFNTTLASALYISGTADSLGNDIAPQQYATDKNYSAFNDANGSVESAVFEYGVDAAPQWAHVLLPNYRVFVVDTDSTDVDAPQFKVQITSYYNDASVSGHLSLRILPLE